MCRGSKNKHCFSLGSLQSLSVEVFLFWNTAVALALVPVHHRLPLSYILKNLLLLLMFLSTMMHPSPLWPPNDEPFCILEAGSKSFVVDMGGVLTGSQ